MGHTNEIVDLYAIGFDPILRPRDNPSWLTETIPDDMLDRMRLRENLLDEAGGPLKRLALRRLIGDRDARGIKRAYDAGLRDAMRTVIDEFTLTYPGIKNVEHEYLYAVHGADDPTREGHLEPPSVASSEGLVEDMAQMGQHEFNEDGAPTLAGSSEPCA